jgi:hypothetical protein
MASASAWVAARLGQALRQGACRLKGKGTMAGASIAYQWPRFSRALVRIPCFLKSGRFRSKRREAWPEAVPQIRWYRVVVAGLNPDHCLSLSPNLPVVAPGVAPPRLGSQKG